MVETDADRLAFLADFGELVGWTVGVGPAVTVQALFDNGTRTQARYAEELPIIVTGAMLTLRTVDLPPGAARGDAITARATAYLAKALMPDATGMTIVTLEQDFS